MDNYTERNKWRRETEVGQPNKCEEKNKGRKETENEETEEIGNQTEEDTSKGNGLYTFLALAFRKSLEIEFWGYEQLKKKDKLNSKPVHSSTSRGESLLT